MEAPRKGETWISGCLRCSSTWASERVARSQRLVLNEDSEDDRRCGSARSLLQVALLSAATRHLTLRRGIVAGRTRPFPPKVLVPFIPQYQGFIYCLDLGLLSLSLFVSLRRFNLSLALFAPGFTGIYCYVPKLLSFSVPWCCLNHKMVTLYASPCDG